MIRKYTFGTPLITEAVIRETDISTDPIPHLAVKNEGWELSCPLKDDVVFGLGQQIRGINKRGWLYISNCTDDPNHTEGKHSLYGAHNFLLIDGEKCFGLFLDTPGKVTFDIGYTKTDLLSIHFAEADYDCYIIEGTDKPDIIKQFRSLIGQSYIPPKWAFGYGQSRWSYMTENQAKEVVSQYKEQDFPLDSLYLDIDYMERYKDFTTDDERFPNFPSFVEEMKNHHIHLVPIIDAGVKIEKGYNTYEEGVKNGYFCKKENNDDFVAAVWPGKVHFPDVLNKDARKWFGDSYQFLLDQGIEGFWNDMNEPAIFYSEDHLKEVFDKLETYKDQNLDIHSFFEFQDMVSGLNNRSEDYASFYHEYRGQKVRHDLVHNLYGYYMTRAAGEAFDRLVPDKRILMFSRSSYIGMHRYGGIWMGDNHAWWSHLLLNIKMLPSLNMCGFLYVGADIGGFGTDTTPDLMLRWLEFAIFTPLMRNHAAKGTRHQELYLFECVEDYRNIVKFRYCLIPYLYSEYVKAALNDQMYAKPLSFVYPDQERTRTVEDQLMIGDELMIAPVYEQNACGRFVYLPEEMKMYRIRSFNSMDVKILEKGDHYIPVALNEVLLFVRPDRIIPLSRGGNYVDDIDTNDLKLLNFIKTETVYEWYDDDGYTKQYNMEKNLTKISMNHNNEIIVSGAKNPHCSPISV